MEQIKHLSELLDQDIYETPRKLVDELKCFPFELITDSSNELNFSENYAEDRFVTPMKKLIFSTPEKEKFKENNNLSFVLPFVKREDIQNLFDSK